MNKTLRKFLKSCTALLAGIALYFFFSFSNASYARSISKNSKYVEDFFQYKNGALILDFEQSSHLIHLDKTITKNGQIILSEKGRVKFSYEGKNEQSYVSNGTYLWVYNNNDQGNKTTYLLNEQSVPKQALSFLLGFGKLKQEFHIKNIKTPNAKNDFALQLKPREKMASYSELIATFHKNGEPKNLSILGKSGNKTTYTFTKVTRTKKIKPDFFELGNGKATPEDIPQ